MPGGKLVVYFVRRDLRVSDNPVLHQLAGPSSTHAFTHLLPVFLFPSHQVEVSGFLKDGESSPYPPARSQVGNFWRCGPHRAKFIAQSVWDLKTSLEALGSGLILRAGNSADVLLHLIQNLQSGQHPVSAVWMTEEHSHEEKQEQQKLARICEDKGLDFHLWKDEKYFIVDEDNGLARPEDLPDVFTTYRKSQEPLRDRPRKALPRPDASTLPAFPESVPPQAHPFVEPASLDGLESRLLQPLKSSLIEDPPSYPDGAKSVHPFRGGETAAHERLKHLIVSGGASSYKNSRNGLLGLDFSTKLSAFLAQGCITARQVHEELVRFEDGKQPDYGQGEGYGQGENEGTRAIRFELLWRDYMRLCMVKFGRNLFRLSGFRRSDNYDKKWKSPDQETAREDQDPPPVMVARQIQRFLNGTTGMGLIDASQRELFHTGYTSNRARQNVASFFSKHLGIDWRYGAEWYEMMLIDYDVSSNWSNWQYVAGVGNDPRGDARIFNPVKQAFDYDKDAQYVKTWLPEVKGLERAENAFQVCTTSDEELEREGLKDNIMVTDPVKRIEFTVDPQPRGSRRAFARKRGSGRGGRGGGNAGGRRGGGGGGGGGGIPAGAPSYGEQARDVERDGCSNPANEGAGAGAADGVSSRPTFHNAARGAWRARGGQDYSSHGFGSRGGFTGCYGGCWDGSYCMPSTMMVHGGFQAYAGPSHGPWQGAWDFQGRGAYCGFAGNGQPWDYQQGTRGRYGGGPAVYQGQPHYVSAPAYTQMHPHIGPSM